MEVYTWESSNWMEEFPASLSHVWLSKRNSEQLDSLLTENIL